MIRTFTVIAALILAAGTSSAQDCANVTVEDAFDLDEAAVASLYACLQEKMATGYASQGDKTGANYRNWAVTATAPGIAGAHSNRLLLTFANEVAAEQYLKFAEDGVEMPVGSVLAKESITVSIKKKTARPGPLFIMTKVGVEKAPDAGGWLYSALQPNGKVMKVKQSFCHDCHIGWQAQDMLAYPLEELRVSQ